MPRAYLTLAALCVALTLPLVAAYNYRNVFRAEETELPSWRLPLNVRPVHYDIELDFTPDSFTKYDWETFRGSMNITVEFMGPDNSMAKRCFNKMKHHIFASSHSDELQCPREGKKNQIIMHADKKVLISSARVYKFDNQQQLKELKIEKKSNDEEKQLIVMDMAKELPPAGTKGLIEMHFVAAPGDNMHGFYVGAGRNRGKYYTITATQFQPSFARLAMPCFDEPEFKATFSLSLAHWPKYRAYATMPEVSRVEQSSEKVLSTFKKTPPMSIHMLAFTIGEYEEPLELQVRDNLKLRAITPPGKREAGHYMLEVAKFALERFEEYIGYEYPLEKLDIVAIPDIDKDNSETWGLVFVRDTLALIDEETKPDSKITTAVNVAHVVVHQWFANLITAEWWDDLWITEGVASQMAFELVAELFPEQSDYFVRISTLSGVLTSDSSGKNHSLSPPESELMSADESYDLFDNIEFMKSGALTRLLQNLLGYEEFRTVLQQLVRANAYGSVNFGDLLGAISTLPKSKDLPIEQILTSWSKLKSYPIINVDYNNDKTKLVIYEEARPTANARVEQNLKVPGQWALPLKVIISAVTADSPATEKGITVKTRGIWEAKAVTLESGTQAVRTVGLPPWFATDSDYIKVSPNPDLSTYYRVRYAYKILMMLQEPVRQQQLSMMDRLHLLDDSRSLAASGLMHTNTFKDVLSWYSGESSAALLIEMLLANQTLSSLDPEIPSPVSDTFMRYFTQDGFSVSGEETLLEQRARMVVLRALVAQGVQEVIEAGLRASDESNGNVALFLREPVYAAVVAAGTLDQMKKMCEHLRETNSHEEQIRLASALARSSNIIVLDQLTEWLRNSDLKRAEEYPIWVAIIKSRQSAHI